MKRIMTLIAVFFYTAAGAQSVSPTADLLRQTVEIKQWLRLNGKMLTGVSTDTGSGSQSPTKLMVEEDIKKLIYARVGAGVSNIYNSNGTLTENRTVTLDNNSLSFNGGSSLLFNNGLNHGISIMPGKVRLGNYFVDAIGFGETYGMEVDNIEGYFRVFRNDAFTGLEELIYSNQFDGSGLRYGGSQFAIAPSGNANFAGGSFGIGGASAHKFTINASDSNAFKIVAPLAVGAATDSMLTIDILGRVHKRGQFSQSVADGLYSALSHTHTFASATSKPTTIAGYGITDYNSLGDARWSLLAHTHTFASATSKPTTIAGYGITDYNSLGDARWSLLGHLHDSRYIPLTGTANGNDITGLIRLSDSPYAKIATINAHSVGFVSALLNESAEVNSTGLTAHNTASLLKTKYGYLGIETERDVITITSLGGSPRGLTGAAYYGGNATDNDYVQKKLLDDRIALSPPNAATIAAINAAKQELRSDTMDIQLDENVLEGHFGGAEDTILFKAQTANKVLASAVSGAGTTRPVFRGLVAADIPVLDPSKMTGLSRNVVASNVQLSNTGTTTENTVYTGTIPANSIGVNGSFHITGLWSWTQATAGTKTIRVKFNGTTVATISGTTVTGTYNTFTKIANRNSLTSQVSGSNASGANTTFNSATSAAASTTSFDTGAAITVTITIQNSDAADVGRVESFEILAVY